MSSRAALDGNWATVEKAVGAKIAAKAKTKAPSHRGRAAPGDPRFDPRADADPRLPRARPPACQSRSARPRARDPAPRGLDPAHLRLHRGRLRPADLPRRRAGPRDGHACARSSRSASAPIAARSASSSCTSPIPTQKAWIQERIEGRDKEIELHARRQAAPSSSKLIEAEGFEHFCDTALHRHQALRPRRRRIHDPGAGADHQARRPARA